MPTVKFEKLDTARMAQIISVALDEFARNGYREASFNRIIKNCDMAKGTMYYYFKSKEDLYLTLYKATIREFAPLLKRANAPLEQPGEVWLMLRDLLDGLWLIMKQKPTIALFVSNGLILHANEEGHPGFDAIHKLRAWLLRWIGQAQKLGAVRNDLSAEALVSIIWGLWESFRSQLPSLHQERSHLHTPLHMLDLFDRILKPSATAKLRYPDGIDLRTPAARL